MPAGRRAQPAPGGYASAQHGFTYLALLVAMLLVALSTQGVMTYVSQQAQREREAELLRLGEELARAIGAYYEATPGTLKHWPASLQDLIEDRRLVVVKRYIREVRLDPITRTRDWGLVRGADGGISGVYSPGLLTPIRSGVVTLDTLTLAPASRYADWLFVYQPALPSKPGAHVAPPRS